MLDGYQDRRVRINGRAIAYTEAGSGPPVLLLHGAWDDRHVWSRMFPDLSAGHHVIAPDTRGHGLSPDADGPWTYEAFADDWIGLVEALNLGPVRVIGHSDGACTALLVALQRPDLVTGLVLMGCPMSAAAYSPEARSFLATITPTGLMSLGDEIAATVQRAIRAYADPCDYDRFFYGLRHTNQVGLTIDVSSLEAVAAPALVLHGEYDGFFDRRHSQSLADALPRGRLELVSAVGHGLPFEDPQPVLQSVQEFLRET